MITAPVEVLLRRLTADLAPADREPALRWLEAAERALTPGRPRVRLSYVDARERLRRARLPRPNPYYPGRRDYLGTRHSQEAT